MKLQNSNIIKLLISSTVAVSGLFLFLIVFMLAMPIQARPATTDIPIFKYQLGSSGASNSQFDLPQGVATDSSGNIYVADYENNRIQKFDADGTYLVQWGSLGSGDGQFYYPTDVTTDSNSNVLVVDSEGNRIQKFNSSGSYISQFGSSGTGNGQFAIPQGVVIDSAGNIYVLDTGNRRIQKFNSSGSYISQFGTYGIGGDGQLNSPEGITIDSAGNIYVADTGNHRIQKFDADGNYLAQWGSSGTGEGQFSFPRDIAVDSAGSFYVADTDNNRIQKFDADGNYLAQWGSNGSGDGQFNGPRGIFVNKNGSIYVADTDNNRIQKFSYPVPAATVSNINSDGSSANSNVTISIANAYTEITCSSTVTEASLATQDNSHIYPLGLVKFCLDVPAGSTQDITLTYETDLKPSDVVAKKYNPSTRVYEDVEAITITEDQINSKHVIILTYQVTDGGILDEDGVANGEIIDPIGLAVTDDAKSNGTLANTGIAIVVTVIGGAGLLISGMYTYFDYKKHKTPLLREDPNVSYTYLHHLKYVSIPLASYRLSLKVSRVLPKKSSSISKF